MIHRRHKQSSIYSQLLLLLLAAALFSAALCLLVNRVGQNFINHCAMQTNYLEEKTQAYADKLQAYVDENDVSSKDNSALSSWVGAQQILTVQVYKDNILTYDSEYPDAQIWGEEISGGDYEWQNYYDIDFSDGEAEVVIVGNYSYQFMHYLLLVDLAVIFFSFTFFLLFAIVRKMNYIKLLSKEIQLLEAGDLDYPITIQGNDELSTLATGLNKMRASFISMMRKDAEMVEKNQQIVTQMSHDLRTPITSIMLYTELLKKGKYKDQEQLNSYLDKIEQKSLTLKELSSNLFEYSLISGQGELTLEEAAPLKFLFYDFFSEMFSYLEQKGFRLIFQNNWPDYSLQISTDYVARILDNISSNIIKYADSASPVIISFEEEKEEDLVGFSFYNKILLLDEKENSTGIGLQSIRNMMEQMGGCCRVKEKDGYFCIAILFPEVCEHKYGRE